MRIELQHIDLISLQYGLSPIPSPSTTIAPPVMQTPPEPVHQRPTPPLTPPPAPQSATHEFWSLVRSETAKGATRQSAIAHVVRSHQDLHAKFLVEANAEPVTPAKQSATATYNALVAARIKETQCSRTEAMKHVNRHHADARLAFVAEANAK